MTAHIIIGKNFGDEGKGLAVDWFASLAQRRGAPTLVIRHNGGGQAGHTVELPGKRFIFHQLSAGSFRGADTLWGEHFLPDFYKLGEEISGFSEVSSNIPNIYAMPACRCVLIDDVVVNMALEESRGKNRHGSCGMGINEAVERSEIPDFRLSVQELAGMTAQDLTRRMMDIRKHYIPLRLAALGLTEIDMGFYGEILRNPNVIANAAEEMCRGAERVRLVSNPSVFLENFEEIIFEGAQGLLLDADNSEFSPHVTASRTGLPYPQEFCRNYLPGMAPEVVYVSRTYVTRHGAGPLPWEGQMDPAAFGIIDRTNLPNSWQGALRFAPHPDLDGFYRPIYRDIGGGNFSLMLTHWNETSDNILFSDQTMDTASFVRDALARPGVQRVYLSHSRYAQDISVHRK